MSGEPVTEEKNYFTCGYCIYAQLHDPPKGTDYPNKRGYCIFEPPKVFPMPHAKQTKIQAMGNQQVEFAPYMMRPVVEENEPMCGRGVLTVEAMKALGVDTNAGKGCDNCNCDTEQKDGS